VGHFTAVVGDSASGKTDYALRCSVAALKRGEPVLYIDADSTLGLSRALERIGRSERFWLVSPLSAQQALKIALQFCRQRAGGLLVLDSIDGLEPVVAMRRQILRLSLPRLVGAAYAGAVRVLLLAHPSAQAAATIWPAYCHQIHYIRPPKESQNAFFQR
jgi:hypothetical protein